MASPRVPSSGRKKNSQVGQRRVGYQPTKARITGAKPNLGENRKVTVKM